MPSGSFFSFQVHVGDSPVPEIRGKDDNYYIETDLNVDGVSFTKEESTVTKYGEKEHQSWPVTPYKVVVSVAPTPSDTWYWFDMYVDGSRVWNKPLRNGRSMTVDATKDSITGSFRELLFSLPRYQTDASDQIEDGRQSEISSIVITCKEAIFEGFRETTFYERDTSRKGTGVTAKSDFYQATKADCPGGGRLTTATGRELFRFTDRAQGYGRQRRFARGRMLEELCLHYRMRQTLIDMGLVKESSPTIKQQKPLLLPKQISPILPKSPLEEKLKRHLQNMDVLNESFESMTVDQPSPIKLKAKIKSEKVADQPFDPKKLQPIKTRVHEEVITVKGEDGKDVKMTRRVESMPLERYVRVDDDLYIVESLDDSVVLIGDDDCFVVEPPVQEFPYVELE